jgi:hypothetical protein
MRNAIMILLALLGVVAGCSRSTYTNPSASPSVTTQAGCEREGGAWNVASGTCDFGGKGPK